MFCVFPKRVLNGGIEQHSWWNRNG